MNVFDIFDAGLSQSRGLTLFELCKAQFGQLYRLHPELHAEATVSGGNPESGNFTTNSKYASNQKAFDTTAIELKANIDEAISCLNIELSGTHGGRATTKLLEMRNQLSDLYKA